LKAIHERRAAIFAEFLGTALLVATVVGSGIMGERLANGNSAIALLANSIATGAMLVVLISTFSRLSGAHFNPVVTLALACHNRTSIAWNYLLAQSGGALTGVATANVMFGLSPLTFSQQVRSGMTQVFSEAVATFGLLMVMLVCSQFRQVSIPYVVAAYITATYWFTASTSFANPAVAVARALTDTFSGIRPVDVPGFIVGEIVGGVSAVVAAEWMCSSGMSKKGSA
jgi:glycerol uptake facilitator-like aquaporin